MENYNNINFRNNLIELFVEQNSKTNLSAIRKKEDIFKKHILDSIELNKLKIFHDWDLVIDIWSWSGFPVIPLAMTNQNINFTWVESIWKKVRALDIIKNWIWIENLIFLNERAENLKKKYNKIICRWFWKIDKIFTITKSLIKKNWHFVLYKMYSQNENQEIIEYIKKNKYKLLKSHNYKIFENDIDRIIYIIWN